MSDLLNAALDYAERGLPVFAIWPALPSVTGRGFICGCGRLHDDGNAAKHPMPRLAPNGFKSATLDKDCIRQWWTSAPNANIGVATGRGCIVLDIDLRHDGDKTLAVLEQQHGAVPPTWRATTGGGGVHLYFTTDVEVRNSAGKIGPGIDIRGDGGYVVAPPSLHISGNRYTWDRPPEQTAAPMPAWLLATTQQAQAAKGATPTAVWRDLVKHGVGEGRRNDVITRLAGHLLRRDIDPLVVFEILTTWNAVRCRPPLDQNELAGIVARIAERELKRREEML
jgi:hypothetical protein